MVAQAKIGIRINELRKKAGLSQEKLAHLSEIDRTYITGVENGKRNISINNIDKISQALGVSLSDFFNDEIFR